MATVGVVALLKTERKKLFLEKLSTVVPKILI